MKKFISKQKLNRLKNRALSLLLSLLTLVSVTSAAIGLPLISSTEANAASNKALKIIEWYRDIHTGYTTGASAYAMYTAANWAGYGIQTNNPGNIESVRDALKQKGFKDIALSPETVERGDIFWAVEGNTGTIGIIDVDNGNKIIRYYNGLEIKTQNFSQGYFWSFLNMSNKGYLRDVTGSDSAQDAPPSE